MSARMGRVGAVVLLLMSLVVAIGWAQGVAPKGIIPTPPESSELEVRIWVDRGAYSVGESLVIHYSVNKPSYVYIWDITPDGTSNQVFPGFLGSNNYVTAGEHVLPSAQVAPPLGTEYLQILATTSPVDPFAHFSPDPESFQAQIEVQILGLVPVSERSWNFTSFEIVSGTVPSYGILDLRSVPPGAAISIDDGYAGYTPKTVYVSQGFHRIAISKSGYQTWQSAVFVIGGRTRTITATLPAIVPANQPPVPAFTFTPTATNVGDWIQFDASAAFDPDGTVVGYAWSFGDGSTGSERLQWYRYASGGTFTVTLTVTDDDGARASVNQTLQIGPTNQQPVAAFVANPSSAVPGGWIQFDASTSYDVDGTLSSYAWNFDDGGTRSGSTVWYQFSTPGIHSVTLRVTDNQGAQDVVSHTVQIGTPNLPPTAAFTFTPVNPSPSQWVQFDAATSHDPDGTIAAYSWSFGDGSSAQVGNPVFHSFAASGTYSVTLTVTDDDGATDAETHTIQVGTPQQPPVAAFTSTPTSALVGQPITLNGSTSYDPDGTVVSYQWDLNGDGVNDASGSTVQVNYSNAGTVPVRLTVTDNAGLQGSVTKSLVVLPVGPSSSGAPAMGLQPGFFVWGTDSWHITVNAGSGWSVPRNYRIELKTDGSFATIKQAAGGVVPLGLVPTPTTGGKTLVFEGSLQSGSVDYAFTVPGATSLWMSLKIDTDGNGSLETSAAFVYLRAAMVHPTTNPFVVGLPQGYSGPLLPSIDFRTGVPLTYSETASFVLWGPSISQLGG